MFFPCADEDNQIDLNELRKFGATEIGARHLPRVDGMSTAARPSIVVKTILDSCRFRNEYTRAVAERRGE